MGTETRARSLMRFFCSGSCGEDYLVDDPGLIVMGLAAAGSPCSHAECDGIVCFDTDAYRQMFAEAGVEIPPRSVEALARTDERQRIALAYQREQLAAGNN